MEIDFDEIMKSIMIDKVLLSNGLFKVRKELGENNWGICLISNDILIPFEYDEIGDFYEERIKVAKRNGKLEWGCLDINGNVIIPFEYDAIEDCTDGKIKVRRDGKWGCFNDKGNIIIPCEYEVLGNFIDGKVKAKKGWKWGYIDDKGEPIIPFIYDEIGNFCEGKVKAKKIFGEWGCLDDKGKPIIPFIYDEIGNFNEGKVKAKEKYGSWGYLDHEGKVVIPFEYYKVEDFIDGKAKVQLYGGNGYINENNEILISSEIILSNGLLKGEKMGKWGVYSDRNNIIIPFEYDEIEDFIDDIVKVRKKAWGYLNDKNIAVIPCEYDEIEDFVNDIVKVRKGDYWGCLNNKGEVIIPFRYDEIGDFIDGIIKARRGNYWGYIDQQGEDLISSEVILSNGLFKGEKFGKWGIYSNESNIVAPFEYDYLEDFNNGKIFAIKNGFPGYLNEDGEVLIMAERMLSNGYWCGEKFGKLGIYTSDNRTIVPFEYDRIEDFIDGKVKVCQEDDHELLFWGYFDDQGNVVVPCAYNEIGDFQDKKVIACRFSEDGKSCWGCLNDKGEAILPFWYRKLKDLTGDKVKAYYTVRLSCEDEINGCYQNLHTLGYFNCGKLWGHTNYEEIYITEKAGIVVSSEKMLDNGYLKGLKFGRWGVYTVDNKIIIPFEYDEIGNFIDGEIEVGEHDSEAKYLNDRNNWDRGYVNEDHEIIPFVCKKTPEIANEVKEIPKENIHEYSNESKEKCIDVVLSNGFFKHKEVGRWCVYSDKNDMVIPLEYDEIWDFEDGIVKVRKGHLCGYLDVNGDVVIPLEYYSLGEVKEGKIKACKRGRWGYIDMKNHIIIPFIYHETGDFKDGIATVYKWDEHEERMRCGQIDDQGYEIISQKTLLFDGIYKGEKFGRWGVFDNENNVIISFICSDIFCYNKIICNVDHVMFSIGKDRRVYSDEYILSNGLYKGPKPNGWGVYTNKNEVIIPFEYQELGDFYEGKVKSCKNGFWGILDDRGNIVIPFIYDEMKDFHEGKVVACKNGYWGCLDSNGHVIIPFEYNYLGDFKGGLTKARKGDYYKWEEDSDAYDIDDDGREQSVSIRVLHQGLYGYLNEKGNIVIPFKCIKLGDFHEGKVTAYLRQQGWICLNASGEIITSLCEILNKYCEVGDFHENKIKVCSGNLWGCIDINGNIIIPFEYEELGDFHEGKIKAKKYSAMWGCLDEKGSSVIPFEYQELGDFHERKVRANTLGRWGCIDVDRNTVIPFEYDEIKDFIGGQTIAYKKYDSICVGRYINDKGEVQNQ